MDILNLNVYESDDCVQKSYEIAIFNRLSKGGGTQFVCLYIY